MSLKIAGRKKGMTKIFDKEGNVVVCTVLLVEPNIVAQVKTKEVDGYKALQLAALPLSASRKKNLGKPVLGHFASKKVEPMYLLHESRIENTEDYKSGDAVDVDYFEQVKFVDVTATSKGKGFQGVIKRYGFAGGPGAHGSGFHRHSGSTGMRTTPGRTFPGKKMAGHMGNVRVTTQSLAVVQVDKENHVILVKGSVPGPKNGIVVIQKSVKKLEKKS